MLETVRSPARRLQKSGIAPFDAIIIVIIFITDQQEILLVLVCACLLDPMS